MQRIIWALVTSVLLHVVLVRWLWAEHQTRPFQAGVIYAHRMDWVAPAPPPAARPDKPVPVAQVAPSTLARPRPVEVSAATHQPQTRAVQEPPEPPHPPEIETKVDPHPRGETTAEALTPSIGYLGPGEVDLPAEPVGDWVIDTRRLPPDQPVKWHVRVWISANGNVDGWELIGDSMNNPMAQQALQTLDLTVLNPARLDGTAVPSYRNLELSLGSR